MTIQQCLLRVAACAASLWSRAAPAMDSDRDSLALVEKLVQASGGVEAMKVWDDGGRR